jgi:hypothetical protein
MESLALLVSIILLTIVILGPISFALSRLKYRWAHIVGLVAGVAGVLTGAWLGVTVDSSGARIMGLLALAVSGWGAWLNWGRLRSS